MGSEGPIVSRAGHRVIIAIRKTVESFSLLPLGEGLGMRVYGSNPFFDSTGIKEIGIRLSTGEARRAEMK
jgi:hypothetical protein